jgi:hypothetical protein
MLDPLLQLTIAWSLAALFGAALVHKLLALGEWPGVVRDYRLFPGALAGAVAIAVPCAEGLAVLSLLWPRAREAGAWAAAGLLLCYAFAISVNLRRGRTQIDCGCFGTRPTQGIAAWMVWRNVLLALLALALLLPVRPRALSLLEIAVAVTCVATLAFLYPVLAVVARRAPPTYDANYRAALRARAGD